jgi:hypothetical protein
MAGLEGGFSAGVAGMMIKEGQAFGLHGAKLGGLDGPQSGLGMKFRLR